MRAARLRRSIDIETLRSEGRSIRRASFVARARHSGGSETRFAVTAPGSVGGSVERNRARRRVREAFRLAFGDVDGKAFDLLVTARRDAVTVPFSALRDEAASLLREVVR